MLLAIGNSKTGRSTYSFSLPAKTTCRPTEWCSKNCYACKGLFRNTNVQQLYERNLLISADPNFASMVASEIAQRRIKFVRVHVSGDFNSERYLMAWHQIALSCPQTRFLAFTRRTDFSLEKLNALDNFTVRLSVDPSTKHIPFISLPLAIVEGSRYDGVADEVCSGKCTDCGHRCWDGDHNVLLHQH